MGCDYSLLEPRSTEPTTLVSESISPSTPNKMNEFSVKLLLLGDSGVGKSSLMLRFTTGEYHLQTMSTVGIDFKEVRLRLNGRNISLQIWDTAGQERFRTITKSYYRGASGYILVFDLTNYKSFDHIRYWVNEIKTHGLNNSYLILVGNKSDLHEDRSVSVEDGETFAKELGCDYIETSAKDGYNVDKLFICGIQGHLAANPLYHQI